MAKPKTILAMYSGGLDSLGTVYMLLTNPEYKEYRIHIHHVHNVNIERRDRAEAITVKLALEELRRLGYDFDYSESQITSPTYDGNFLWDTDTMNFFAGFACSVNPQIEKVAIGMQRNDISITLDERRQRADNILAAFTTVKKIYPVMDLTKKEIYDLLPVSLKNMFWSCRLPIYEDNMIKPCLKCKTCLTLKEQGIR